MLEARIREARAKKPVLLMTHIVVGYPSFEASLQIVDAMVEAGVDLMELQIPFSEHRAQPSSAASNSRPLSPAATASHFSS